MAVLNINKDNLIAGESTTDAISDRGFSPDSVNLNLTKKRGMLYFAEAPTDRGGATLTGNVLASCEDPAFSGNDAYLIDDEGAYYTYNGTTLTKQFTGADTYTLGTTDLIPFNDGNFYATTTTSVVQFNNNMGTVTEHWWTGLNTSYRHPLEVVEKELFLADKNVIYYWDGTTSGTAFTLPSGQNVTTLRKHPDGKTLLAFTGGTADFSHTRNGRGKVYYCQPTLRGAAIEGWSREVPIEAQVEGSRLSGGVIYTTWGKNLGIFDGNGLIKLKELETSTTTYNQNMNNMEDILLVRDGRHVLAYGDLGAGKVFWKLFKNTTNSNEINNIHYKGDNVLLTAFQGASAGTGLLEEVDYDNSGVGTDAQFYTNRISFGTDVHINRIDLLHTVTNSGGNTEFNVFYRDLEDTVNTIEQVVHASVTATKTRIKCDIKTDVFQLRLTPSTGDLGYRLIRIYYEDI